MTYGCLGLALQIYVAMMLMPQPVWADSPGVPGQPSPAQQEAAVHGHDDGLFSWPGITGHWGGARQSLDDGGITIEGAYTGEFVRGFPGGMAGGKSVIYEDNLDISITMDSEKMGLWPGGTLFVYGLRNHGGDPSANTIGDLQTASNIEAPDNALVQEAWYEQQFLHGVLSILVGLHDLNSEFYVTDYGSLFINSSFGVGPDMSANVALSIFPKAGLAARVRVAPNDNTYVQAAIYDGDPSTRALHGSEGKLMIGEAGLSSDTGTYKLGYWNHSADITVGAHTYNNDYGLYGVIDQELMHFDGDSTIGAFLQYGWAPAARNTVTRYIGGGLHLHGLIPTRDEDDIGIALARADTHAVAETTLELTYRLVLTPWLAIQPSYQVIQNPGGDATVPTANVGLLRFEVAL